jgi:hypothetical protein
MEGVTIMYFDGTIHGTFDISPIGARRIAFIAKRPQRETWIGKRLAVRLAGRSTTQESVGASTPESAPTQGSEARSPPPR